MTDGYGDLRVSGSSFGEAPRGPVVVTHILDDRHPRLTVCGAVWWGEDASYPGVPRLLCPLCSHWSMAPQPAGRPDWDDYFLDIAKAVAARADCTRAKHGAVIVSRNRIISTGYNGSPPGAPSCLAGECPRGQQDYASTPGHLQGNHDFSNCIALHSEQNAIARAREQGDTIYITGKPCDMCSKLIKAAGITRVVYP